MAFIKHNIKYSEKYKRVRTILNNLFGSADWRDNIKDGVSFKWYFDNRVTSCIPGFD